LEARVGIEPTYKGFADPALALVSSFLQSHLVFPLSLRANFGPTPSLPPADKWRIHAETQAKSTGGFRHGQCERALGNRTCGLVVDLLEHILCSNFAKVVRRVMRMNWYMVHIKNEITNYPSHAHQPALKMFQLLKSKIQNGRT
jgi:hypothetical protein